MFMTGQFSASFMTTLCVTPFKYTLLGHRDYIMSHIQAIPPNTWKYWCYLVRDGLRQIKILVEFSTQSLTPPPPALINDHHALTQIIYEMARHSEKHKTLDFRWIFQLVEKTYLGHCPVRNWQRCSGWRRLVTRFVPGDTVGGMIFENFLKSLWALAKLPLLCLDRC